MIDEQSFPIIQQRVRKSFSKAEMQSWVRRSEWRVWVDLSLIYGCVALALVGLSFFPSVLAGVAAFVVIGVCQYHLFIIAHDGVHRNLSNSRARNDFITRWLIYGAMFMGFEDAKRNHLKHHQTLGTHEDPDRYLHTLGGKNTRFKFLLFCSGLLTFLKTVLKVTPFGRLLFPTPDAADGGKPKAQNALRAYFVDRIPVMILQPAIFGAFLALGLPWWSYFALWVAPIYFLVFLPDEIRAFCDHAVPHLPDEAGDPHRLVSFEPSRVEAIFLSPLNMNYHAEHHLWTAVPYYNLPKAHAALKDNPAVTVRRGYVTFLADLLRNFPAPEPQTETTTAKTITPPAASPREVEAN